MTNEIEFICWEKDEPIEVQLEPEAILFIVLPDNSLKFKGNNPLGDFKWALRIDHKQKGIQLFPASIGQYRIEVFENDLLLEENDWHKYMKR